MYVCMDGTGVPDGQKETAGRQGKGETVRQRPEEAKLGCVYTDKG